MTAGRVPGLFDAQALEQAQLRDGVNASVESKVSFFETMLDIAHASGALDADKLDYRDNVLLFFALRPDAHACEQIRERAELLVERNRLHGCKLRGNYHITLSLPGPARRLRTERDNALIRTGDRVRFAPVEITLDAALGFRNPGNSPFVLRASSDSAARLTQLQAAVRGGLAHEGFLPSSARDFVPHVTLAYTGEHIVEPQPIEPIRWRSDELFLIRSHQGQGRHEIMGAWPLVPDDATG